MPRERDQAADPTVDSGVTDSPASFATNAAQLAHALPSQAAPDLAVSGPLVTVRILDLPLGLLTQAQQWSDGLTREFALIASPLHRRDMPLAERPLPARLVRIIEILDAGYGPFTGEPDAVLADAVAAGAATLPELVYQLPASAGAAAAALRDLMNEAEEYCQQGEHLLTLTSPEDVTAFRRWFLDEFERQCAGADPVPWPEYPGNSGA